MLELLKESTAIIYTVEGNSGDRYKQMKYPINSKDILGFGTPLYTN